MEMLMFAIGALAGTAIGGGAALWVRLGWQEWQSMDSTGIVSRR
jgi:hypothetical protein